jgi:hypothetical protein
LFKKDPADQRLLFIITGLGPAANDALPTLRTLAEKTTNRAKSAIIRGAIESVAHQQ